MLANQGLCCCIVSSETHLPLALLQVSHVYQKLATDISFNLSLSGALGHFQHCLQWKALSMCDVWCR